jgi:hypothetical protein
VKRLLRRFPWSTLYTALLVLAEAAVIQALILPYPSQREDWLIGTLLIAPVTALGLILAVMLPLRLAAGFVAFIRRRLEHD